MIAAAVVITVFLLIVVGLIVVLTVALFRQVRSANAADEGTFAPTLYRTRLMTAGRRPQSDWSSADRRVVPADAVAKHRRRGRIVAPVPLDAAVGVSGVAPGVRVDPPTPVADVRRIFSQVMAAPVVDPAVPPAEVDIEQLGRDLSNWVADPNHTGPLPRVLS